MFGMGMWLGQIGNDMQATLTRTLRRIVLTAEARAKQSVEGANLI